MSTLKARTGLDIALLEDPDAFSFLLSGKNPDVDTAALEGI